MNKTDKQANQRIKELEISNRDGQRLINELNWQLAESERKLADALKALENIKRHQEVVAGDYLPKRGATWLIADKALAEIDK